MDISSQHPTSADPPVAAGGGPTMYAELASWWPLLSSPAEYAEEAAFYEKTLVLACGHQEPVCTSGFHVRQLAECVAQNGQQVVIDRHRWPG